MNHSYTHSTILSIHPSIHAKTGQILFAMSPLLVLGYVLVTGFDDKDEEEAKRKKKTDFQLEGHDE
jgi:hypothetical protein